MAIDPVQTFLSLWFCRWNNGAILRAYKLVVEHWIKSGINPTHLAATAPGVGRRYGAYSRKTRALEKCLPDEIKSWSLKHMPAERPARRTDWLVDANASAERNSLLLGYATADVAMSMSAGDLVFRSLADVARAQYGFVYRQRASFMPIYYHYGMTEAMTSSLWGDESGMSISWWSVNDAHVAHCQSAGVLRDIYPTSYLSRPYLDARLGHSRTTLEQWINADSGSRGTLEPFTDLLTKWTPPVEKIPQIREELYRAGRVFYWRFFNPKHGGWMGVPETIEPLYRPDLSAPWQAPDPIPEIFRADFWKDKDPSLTY